MDCLHSQLDYTINPPVCTECGFVCNPAFEYNRVNIYFGETIKDFGNTENKSIQGLENDITNNAFPRDIIQCANEYFKEYLRKSKLDKQKTKITRSKPRRSIIFACFYLAYMEKRPQNVNPVVLAIKLRLINENKGKPLYKSMGQGIKILLSTLKIPNRSIIIVEPPHTVYTIMKTYNICTRTHLPEIYELYNYIEYKCSSIKKSKPHSIASALFWFWYCLKNMSNTKNNTKLTLIEFANYVGLCVNTINKLVKSMQNSISYFNNHPNKRVISTKRGRTKK